HVESIIGVIKKHVDHRTLLKELVTVIEQELEKEAQYTRIKDYYGSNLSVGLISTYNTIFKDVNSVLSANLNHVNKKVQFGTMISLAKTSTQIVVSEDVTEELTDTLSLSNIMLQESSVAAIVIESTPNLVPAFSTTTQITQQPLENLSVVSNPEYYKPK
ncbi:17590_t:CDS:2, partial [Racocetra fulgida]